MYSKFVPFEEIIEGVKDDTGITNLRNHYPQIRRLMYRCEKDIGFGGSLVLRKIVYTKTNGSIINNKIKLPDDILKIESSGMCREGVCPKDYKIQGNFMFLCRDFEKVTFIYYTLFQDGEGNPVTTLNHKEAVISGIAYYMAKAKRYNGEMGQAVFKELEDYYEDRIGEARGEDAWPNTQEEWAQISDALKRSFSETLIYDSEQRCFCAIEEVLNPNAYLDSNMHYWQYSDIGSNISLAPSIDLNFLATIPRITSEAFLAGMTFTQEAVGRIAFAFTNVEIDTYQINDTYGENVTALVFDTYYNEELKIQIYISKEYYSLGNIYFKLIPNL